uniref:Uncharacterized protein n=1 Tax=Solanum tuberosum TaxID=4113 RepID=M1DLM3_SOLTU
MSVDRDFPYPTSDTNYGRPARTVIRSTVRRFRFSVSRSRLDRFPIFSSAASVKVRSPTHAHDLRTIGGPTPRPAGSYVGGLQITFEGNINLNPRPLPTGLGSIHGSWMPFMGGYCL